MCSRRAIPPSPGHLPQLEARRTAVVRLLESLDPTENQGLRAADAAADRLVDDLDRASSAQGQDAASRLAKVLSGNQLQIDRAMERAAQGRYGMCEDCGRAISFERLRVWPEATRCVECQKRHEMGPDYGDAA
jgi:RNA polymerase-binding transcription factor DksA